MAKSEQKSKPILGFGGSLNMWMSSYFPMPYRVLALLQHLWCENASGLTSSQLRGCLFPAGQRGGKNETTLRVALHRLVQEGAVLVRAANKQEPTYILHPRMVMTQIDTSQKTAIYHALKDVGAQADLADSATVQRSRQTRFEVGGHVQMVEEAAKHLIDSGALDSLQGQLFWSGGYRDVIAKTGSKTVTALIDHVKEVSPGVPPADTIMATLLYRMTLRGVDEHDKKVPMPSKPTAWATGCLKQLADAKGDLYQVLTNPASIYTYWQVKGIKTAPLKEWLRAEDFWGTEEPKQSEEAQPSQVVSPDLEKVFSTLESGDYGDA